MLFYYTLLSVIYNMITSIADAISAPTEVFVNSVSKCSAIHNREDLNLSYQMPSPPFE